MRLFLALEVPRELREMIGEAVRNEKGHLPEARWVRPEAMHLTLVFLGETAPELVPDLEPAAAAVFAARRPLELAVEGAGSFPPKRPARVLWLAFRETEEGRLADLQGALQEALAGAIGFEPDRRPFHPHLTLARCRKPWPRRPVERFAESFGRPWGQAYEVHEGRLVESRLEPSGARYRTVASFPFSEAA